MSKVSYANLKLKVNTEVKQVKWGEEPEQKIIEVAQYLPIDEKYDLIMITLQKAKEDILYNPIKLDMYFHLHLVYMYTNLYFTDKQKEDEAKIYDALEGSGLLTEIIKNMNEAEYNDLWEKINDYMEAELRYTTTTAAALRAIINDLPAQAQAAADIVNNFDKEKFSEVTNFAKALNGGRDI